MRISTDPKEIKRRMAAWEKYLANAPEKISDLAQKAQPRSSTPELLRTDVVVVGGGMAGAAAAIDAADLGAKVVVLDLFEGGGSTRRSGGVVYGGGGTDVQQRVGISDRVEDMTAYVRAESNGVVSDAVVDRFCQESAANIRWLSDRGVDFSGKLYDTKSSYPPSDVSLYLSGSEKAYPFSSVGRGAPRGHRPLGDHLTGNVLWDKLEIALDRHTGIANRHHMRCERLLIEDGAVVGVAGSVLPEEARSLHSMLGEIAATSSVLGNFASKPAVDGSSPPALWSQCIENQSNLFEKLGRPFEVRSSRGVVLSTGGFGFNLDMLKHHASQYVGLCPLGNLGDQGSGIQMAMDIGAAASNLDRCSAWKFINPPVSFAKGILLDPDGCRIRNEDCYGATLADVYIQKHGGKAWLLIDQALADEAMASLGELAPDQSGVALGNLFKNREQEETLEDLATACGMQTAELLKSVEVYNDGSRNGKDPFHKQANYLAELKTPPFTAINMDVRSKWWPTPMMTLGGLRVDDNTGQVINASTSSGIPGLYAAGRTAVGVCSNSYVSGLSLADCLFSGRRAGRALGKAATSKL